jgi:flagellar motor switch protein FliM
MLKLDRNIDDGVELSINGKERFIADVGVRRYRKSLKIREKIIGESDDLKNLLEEISLYREGEV